MGVYGFGLAPPQTPTHFYFLRRENLVSQPAHLLRLVEPALRLQCGHDGLEVGLYFPRIHDAGRIRFPPLNFPPASLIRLRRVRERQRALRSWEKVGHL